jgi:hypothetical protein
MASSGSGDEPEGGEGTDPAPAARPAAGADTPAAPRGRSRDPTVFVLLRELSEVHLLLDNISANPNTTISDPPPVALPDELGKDWIERVCQISWPPDGSTEERAEDAALLIRAKDYLNRLSHPASGSTIAFTTLVTQGDAERKKLEAEGDDISSRPPTRSSLAQAAYPDLVAKAAGFRRWMTVISGGLLVVLIVTCILSWYTAYGNAALSEYASAEAAAVLARTAVDEAEIAEVQAPGPAASDEAQPAPVPRYCSRKPATAAQSQLCDARWKLNANVQRVQRRLYEWLCLKPFSRCDADDVARPEKPLTDQQQRSYDDGLLNASSRAAALVNIMGSAVLPFLYGLLGAGAAIIRSLSRKIRASLLSPRDLHLSVQQLALGAVVGACIGLFIAAPGSDNAAEGLLGPIALSASAISFVAGFGVEAVFQALEALIARIFNIAPVANANRGDGIGSN